MPVGKYVKKPIVIEAMRVGPETSYEEIQEFCPKVALARPSPNQVQMFIPTLEGNMRLNRGDWIIKGIQGEFYPCKDEIFRETYDEVNNV